MKEISQLITNLGYLISSISYNLAFIDSLIVSCFNNQSSELISPMGIGVILYVPVVGKLL
jgi:hypothetical protein